MPPEKNETDSRGSDKWTLLSYVCGVLSCGRTPNSGAVPVGTPHGDLSPLYQDSSNFDFRLRIQETSPALSSLPHANARLHTLPFIGRRCWCIFVSVKRLVPPDIDLPQRS